MQGCTQGVSAELRFNPAGCVQGPDTEQNFKAKSHFFFFFLACRLREAPFELCKKSHRWFQYHFLGGAFEAFVPRRAQARVTPCAPLLRAPTAASNSSHLLMLWQKQAGLV